jgi:hypothetical protein
MQDLHIHVALFSETHLKPHEVLYSKLPYFIALTAIQAEKTELLFQLPKPPPTPKPCKPIPLDTVEVTAICSSIVLLAVVKSPVHACSDAAINELLSFIHKTILARGPEF